MNYNDQSAGATNGSLTDAELMQVTPIWEQRGKKKKGFGRVSAAAPTPAETRTFDEPLPTSPLDAPRVESEPMAYTAAYERRVDRLDDPMLASDEPTLVAPVGRPRPATTVRKGGIAPMAVAAGVLALAGVGAAGWYATRDNDGVPELTPGSSAPATVAVTEPPLAAPMPGEPSRTTTVRAEAPAPARTTQVARAAPRARPAAAAPAASSTGIDASTSAVVPATPQPYSGTATAPAPSATPDPIPATPPVEAAPPVTTEPVPQPAPEAAPQPVEPEPPM